MNAFIQDVESELQLLKERLVEALPVELEYQDDLQQFGTDAKTRSGAQRERRYLEWFLLERPSEALGSIPLEQFFAGLAEDVGVERARAYAALRGSRVGVFLVARIAENDGLLLEDLLGRGQYVVPDPLLVGGIDVGDLIVGRIYPEDLEHAGEKTNWGLSSAAAVFRNDQLVRALKRDLEAMRGRTRGPLRMTQADIEQMFFSRAVVVERDPEEAPRLDPRVSERAARALLDEAGIGPDRAAEFLATLALNPLPEDDLALGGDDPLGWILEELAFETSVALDHARSVLADYWRACAAAEKSKDMVGESDSSTSDAAAALARFDEGRAAGKNLDALFAQLEAELGIEDAGPSVDDGPLELLAADDESEDAEGEEVTFRPAPDFPGVLGALVQEFLWDAARIEGVELETFAMQHRNLELFAQFGMFLGHADELADQHVELFLGRWIWEAGRLALGDYDAEGAIRSTRAFCAWLAEFHSSELLTELGGLFEGLLGDARRIQELNRSVGEANPERKQPATLAFFEFVSTSGEEARWLDQKGGAVETQIPKGCESLMSGDMVAAERQGSLLNVWLIYPAFGAPYLKATS